MAVSIELREQFNVTEGVTGIRHVSGPNGNVITYTQASDPNLLNNNNNTNIHPPATNMDYTA